MSSNHSTREKLLIAAIEIMSQKGYDAATTKEIAAAAGVNEVTLFRHFGTKQKLVENAFNQYHYAEEFTKLFNEELKGELHSDLLLISRTYHKLMFRNRKLLSITHKGSSSMPDEVLDEAARHPLHLKKLLTSYLTDMAAQNKVISSNFELQAQSFMWMNYGAFMSKMNEKVAVPEDALDEFIEESVWIFARALTP
jgi:TetR/AcrR family transcriptional repressor of mexJK operon